MPDRSTRPVIQKDTRCASRTARLFFAIWPDEMAQEEMARLAQRVDLESRCRGRKTRPENIHLTLVFIGEVDVIKLEALCGAARQTQALGICGFHLVFDSIRYWKHNQIVYATAGVIPPELTHLVTGLQSVVSAAGFGLGDRPYIPHITLMKRASCRGLPELRKPIVWRVGEWMLVKSEQTSGGSVYSPVHRWSLA